MTKLKKGLLWAAGCLTIVFALSVGLSWYSFGYLDPHTVTLMAMMLFPVLGAIAWVALAEFKRDRAANAAWHGAQAGHEDRELVLPDELQPDHGTIGSWVDAPSGKNRRELEMPAARKAG